MELQRNFVNQMAPFDPTVLLFILKQHLVTSFLISESGILYQSCCIIKDFQYPQLYVIYIATLTIDWLPQLIRKFSQQNGIDLRLSEVCFYRKQLLHDRSSFRISELEILVNPSFLKVAVLNKINLDINKARPCLWKSDGRFLLHS